MQHLRQLITYEGTMVTLMTALMLFAITLLLVGAMLVSLME
jgi:hypothetical protein